MRPITFSSSRLPRLFLGLIALNVNAADWVGDIPNGTVWPGGAVQRIIGNVTIPEGATLTINAGAIVKFNGATTMLVSGNLDANGSSGSPVVFTSDRDDSVGGDTNGDGGNTEPFAGAWNRVDILGTGNADLNWVDVRYGGDFTFGSSGSIEVNGGTLTMTNGSIRDSDTAGIHVISANPDISGVDFIDNTGDAIRINVDANPAVSGVTFTNNRTNGIAVDGGTLTLSGFWDDPDAVYRLFGDVVVPDGLSLTVGADQIVKVNGAADVFVDGTLNANGTSGAPVIFTSDRDDGPGGDTNNDADATTGAPGQWNRLRFSATGAGVLTETQFRYGGDFTFGSRGTVEVAGGDLTMTNGSISFSETSGLRIESADGSVTGSDFTGNLGSAVRLNVDANPALSALTFSDNGTNGVEMDGGTLTVDGLWTNPDVVYRLFGDVVVPEGRSLTVGAGQIVKVNGAVDLFVDGTLNANGTSSAPVIFTSDRDDGPGGDTNNDADATTGAPGQWNRLRFSAAGAGVLTETQFRYGGDFTFGSRGTVEVAGGDLTMTNGSISFSETSGLRIESADGSVTGSDFTGNLGSAVRLNVDANPTLSALTFSDNGTNGVEMDGGTLTGDGLWTNPDVVYRLFGNVVVPEGRTLTVGADQIVKVNGAVGLFVEGTLNANGTSGAPVIFTSDRDDGPGGDTNNDLGDTTPFAGAWNRVDVLATGMADLSWTNVRYGGDFTFGSSGSIEVNGGTLTMTDGSIRDSDTAGIHVISATPEISGVDFIDNTGDAIRMNVDANPAVSGVTFTNNRTNGIAVDGGTLTVNAAWDDPDAVYRLFGDVVVPDGLSLTVGADQIVKVNGAVDLFVDGTLNANGTSGAPVIFTSDRDDGPGGDTNNDADGSTGEPGQWNRLRFSATGAGVLTETRFRYGGDFTFGSRGTVEVAGGDLTMTNGSISFSETSGLRIESADGSVTGTDFTGNLGSAVRLNVDANPALSALTFSDNGTNGVEMDGGTLTVDGLWTNPDVVYRLFGDVVVPEGRSLTVGAGQIVKVNGAVDLFVDGTLNANGTSSAPVIFTSDRDDGPGGDTNNDLGDTSPFAGAWNAVWAGPGGRINLTHGRIYYGGDFTFGSRGALVADGGQVSGSNLLIMHSETAGLQAEDAGSADVSNCILTRNDLGLRAASDSSISSINCTIDGNAAGAVTNSGNLALTNVIVTSNIRVGIESTGTGSVDIRHSNVFNPAASLGNYSGFTDPTGSNGNISEDPLYAGAASDDYALLDGSPAIDAGASYDAPSSDLLGNPRVDDPGVANRGSGLFKYFDLGAIERQVGSTPSPIEITGPQPVVGSGDYRSLALGDFRGLNVLDAFIANGGGGNEVFNNNGTGTFTDSGQQLGLAESEDVAIADLNGDDILDALVVNSGSGSADQVWLGSGNGSFQLLQSFGNSESYAVALADIDGDYDLDAVIAHGAGGAGAPNRVWLNNGSGIFSDTGQALGGRESRGIALGDLNGDSTPDLFVANTDGKPDQVWFNDGAGTFISRQSIGDADSGLDVALGDLDADGDLDAVVANGLAGGQANRVWVNDGQGNFTDSGQALGNGWTEGVVLGDFNGDGDLDAYFANFLDGSGQAEPDEIWDNSGGILTDTGNRLVGSGANPPWSIGPAMGDLDGDNDADVMVAGTGGASIWLNQTQQESRFVNFKLGRATPIGGSFYLFALEGFPALVELETDLPTTSAISVDFEADTDGKVEEGTVTFDAPGATVGRSSFQTPAFTEQDGSYKIASAELVGASSGSTIRAPESVNYLVFSQDILGLDTDNSRILFGPLYYFCMFAVLCEMREGLELDDSVDYGCDDERGLSAADLGTRLETQRRFREEIMTQSEQGRYYIRRYDQTTSEMAALLFSSPTFAYDVFNVDDEWIDAVESAVDGDGEVVITQAMADSMDSILDEFRFRGSEDLRKIIDLERQHIGGLDSLVGMTVNEFQDELLSLDLDSLFASGFEVTP